MIVRPRLSYLDNNLWLWAKVNATTRWDLLAAPRALRRDPGRFDSVECLCTFVGYQRSGHSVVGSILDAHPDATFAHRLDALRYARAGRSAEEIMYLIVRNSERFARTGRHLTAYSYAIPGQGANERLRVIGDQEGRHSALRLGREPELLRELIGSRALRLRFIHVVRNPFDNIATIANRTGRALGAVIDDYFEMCRGVLAVKAAYGEDLVLDVHHEDLLAQPAAQIERLCAFLDLPAPAAWVERCSQILYATPHRSRASRTWSEAQLDAVRAGMADVAHLARYSASELAAA